MRGRVAGANVSEQRSFTHPVETGVADEKAESRTIAGNIVLSTAARLLRCTSQWLLNLVKNGWIKRHARGSAPARLAALQTFLGKIGVSASHR